MHPPRTPFNDPITAHRRFAFGSASLDTVKQIKSALGATVNDVIMVVYAGGLRTWLETHDALAADPLVALAPIFTQRIDPSFFTRRTVQLIRPGAAT
jgi:diacylglycerol O-acyltransferase / wax synthase